MASFSLSALSVLGALGGVGIGGGGGGGGGGGAGGRGRGSGGGAGAREERSILNDILGQFIQSGNATMVRKPQHFAPPAFPDFTFIRSPFF